MRINNDGSPRIGSKPSGGGKEVSVKGSEKAGRGKGPGEVKAGLIKPEDALAQKSSYGIAGINSFAPENRLRDSDAARLTSQSVRSRMMSNPSTAMLAQANAAPQGVMQFFE